MVDSSCNDFFGAIFSRNDRTTVFNTKNQIIFDSFKKSYKIKKYQNL